MKILLIMDLTIEPKKTSSSDAKELMPATDWEKWYILKNDKKCPDCEKGTLLMWPSPEDYKCSNCGSRFNFSSDQEINRIPTY